MAAIDPVTLAGDVVAGATALAGLMLVYVGSVVSAYAGYDTVAQEAVRGRFRFRAWLGFAGMIVAAASAGLALAGKWENSSCWDATATVLLFVALGWVVLLAALTAAEVS